jgi:hypothetical protein
MNIDDIVEDEFEKMIRFHKNEMQLQNISKQINDAIEEMTEYKPEES